MRSWLLGCFIGILIVGGWGVLTSTLQAEELFGTEPLTTTRLSLWNSMEGNASALSPDAAGNGRWVVFTSFASNWYNGLTHTPQVYLYDRLARTTTLLSLAENGAIPNGKSQSVVISQDGTTIAFQSYASNLVAGDHNSRADIFVAERGNPHLERVSLKGDGTEANRDAIAPTISGDGRYIAFESSDALLPEDTNSASDIYLKDRESGTLQLVSMALTGGAGTGDSYMPAISGDGGWVTFVSNANDLVAGDSGFYYELFIRDIEDGITTKVSVGVGDVPLQGGNCSQSALNQDGEWIVFECDATNLTPQDTNSTTDIFLVERRTGALQLVSRSTSGTATGGESVTPDISPNGNWVGFVSLASTLVENDTNAASDLFLWNRATDEITRASVTADGAENPASSAGASVTDHGELFFHTPGALVADDNNHQSDIYSRGVPWASRTLLLPLIKKE